MPMYFNVDVDIDVHEFMDSCSEKEIREVINWLKDNECISRDVNTTTPVGNFDEQVSKLIGKKHLLTKEQEENILKIAENL